MDEILSGLSTEQLEAVTHKEGPLLIIAGAGTGKTTVITRRIAWLLEAKKAEPSQILALTFTDKAAEEMQERVDILVPYGYTELWILTFHAFGDRILRENALEIGLSPDFQVLTRAEAAVFFREHLFEFLLKIFRPLGNPARFIEAIVNLFSRAKDEDVSPAEYLECANKLKKKAQVNPQDEALSEEAERHLELANCYAKYQELLSKEGKVDFGNQFYLTLEVLRQHLSILKRYQERFKYILVDEFQDTNYAQYQLVKLLGERHKNITVVADDDQSIYRWRGAAYSNIMKFAEEFPEVKKISLIKNFRSTQVILDSAYRLIQHNNPERFEVKSQINKRLEGLTHKGLPVQRLNFDSVETEADEVAGVIQDKVNKGTYNYQDFAILVRSNSDAQSFLTALNMKGIPWRFSGNQGLYSRGEVRIAIAFLRLMANPADSLSLYYLLSCEVYKVPILDLTYALNYARRRNLALFYVLKRIDEIRELKEISEKGRAIMKKVSKDLEGFLEHSCNLSTGRLLYLFLRESGYLKGLVKKPSLVNEAKVQNLSKFFAIVRDFESIAREDRVVHFIEHLDMLIQCGDDPATTEADIDIPAVNVLTVHKAKGLEFKVVFLVSLVMGRFPWPHRRENIELPDELIKDILPEGDFHLQEERRLFYVGMTRAKEELYLTSSRNYGGGRQRRISPFVLEALGEIKEQELKRSLPLQAIARHKPEVAEQALVQGAISQKETINLSYYQIDDYLTCPLKYKYVHILRVPILAHHAVLYGQAMHEAVLKYYQYRLKGTSIRLEEIIEVFEASLKREGFLSEAHLQQRLEVGRGALRNFFHQQEEKAELPAFIEKDFSFMLDKERIIGRWDRVDVGPEGAVIIDFKSSEVKNQKEADKRTRESLQLGIYSLAYQAIFGPLPLRVELYFLESGSIGKTSFKEKDLEKIKKKVKIASNGIRRASYPAEPVYMACDYCAYNQICPFVRLSRR